MTPTAGDPPLYYRITTPGEGDVCARISGEDGPVELSIPGLTRAVPISRDTAWALWAALSDGLMPGTDAIPEWAGDLIQPVDEHGHPVAAPDYEWPF